jgi:hypothetical protein
MADIDVVPKHRSNTWLWIVLAIIVVNFLFWAFAGRSHTTTRRQPPQPGQLSYLPLAARPLSMA